MIYLTAFLFLCVLGLHIKLTNLETKFYKKHEADVRHRDRESKSRSDQIQMIRQRIHKVNLSSKKRDDELFTKNVLLDQSNRTALFAINELQAEERTRVKS
jgi:hypothetical protein